MDTAQVIKLYIDVRVYNGGTDIVLFDGIITPFDVNPIHDTAFWTWDQAGTQIAKATDLLIRQAIQHCTSVNPNGSVQWSNIVYPQWLTMSLSVYIQELIEGLRRKDQTRQQCFLEWQERLNHIVARLFVLLEMWARTGGGAPPICVGAFFVYALETEAKRLAYAAWQIETGQSGTDI